MVLWFVFNNVISREPRSSYSRVQLSCTSRQHSMGTHTAHSTHTQGEDDTASVGGVVAAVIAPWHSLSPPASDGASVLRTAGLCWGFRRALNVLPVGECLQGF